MYDAVRGATDAQRNEEKKAGKKMVIVLHLNAVHASEEALGSKISPVALVHAGNYEFSGTANGTSTAKGVR